jgi:hypothetical protein
MNIKIKKIIPLWLSIRLTKLRNAFLYHNPFCQKEIILGRNACLGNELLRVLIKKNKKYLVINQQKTRIDVFMECINGAPCPQAAEIIKNFRIKRHDLAELIKQQEKLPWLKNKHPVKLLVMDSFSELTDKKFTHKKRGWSFSCHWNDLKHDQNFEQEFSCSGMLPLEELEKNYQNFFAWAEKTHPGIKIFFIHYPDQLEKREKYLQRSQKIKEVLEKIAIQKPFIKNIILEKEKTTSSPQDEFPYHYGQGVYDEMFKKLDTVLEK